MSSLLFLRAYCSRRFPFRCYLIAEQGRGVFADALGQCGLSNPDTSQKPQLDTIYDLASLNKNRCLPASCLRAGLKSGELTLDSSVSQYLPEFDRNGQRGRSRLANY